MSGGCVSRLCHGGHVRRRLCQEVGVRRRFDQGSARAGAREARRGARKKKWKKSDRFGSRARIFLRGSENVRRSCQEAAVCQAAVMIIKLIMLTIMVSIIMMMLILPAAEHHQPLSITSS